MRALWLSVMATLLVGCAPKTGVVLLGSQAVRPIVPPDSVLVYRTAEQVPGKYVEVAELTSDGGTLYGNARLLEELRKKAGELGANAIVLLNTRQPASASVSSGHSRIAEIESGSYRSSAVAIYIER